MRVPIKPSCRVASAILFTAVLAAAQGFGPLSTMRMYDPATEINFKGTVDEVKRIKHSPMMTGIHLMVKTGDETKEVMLGPSTFITNRGFTFAKGDAIELTGSKVTMAGADYILAREVVKDGKTLILRDKNGVPAWSGMRMGRGGPAN